MQNWIRNDSPCLEREEDGRHISRCSRHCSFWHEREQKYTLLHWAQHFNFEIVIPEEGHCVKDRVNTKSGQNRKLESRLTWRFAQSLCSKRRHLSISDDLRATVCRSFTQARHRFESTGMALSSPPFSILANSFATRVKTNGKMVTLSTSCRIITCMEL